MTLPARRKSTDWPWIAGTTFWRSRRRQPIACNLHSLEWRTRAYVTCLNSLPIVAMEQLEGGQRCPFLLDFGLSAEQRQALWQAVWDQRTLVRTARSSPVSDEHLLRAHQVE